MAILKETTIKNQMKIIKEDNENKIEMGFDNNNPQIKFNDKLIADNEKIYLTAIKAITAEEANTASSANTANTANFANTANKATNADVATKLKNNFTIIIGDKTLNIDSPEYDKYKFEFKLDDIGVYSKEYIDDNFITKENNKIINSCAENSEDVGYCVITSTDEENKISKIYNSNGVIYGTGYKKEEEKLTKVNYPLCYSSSDIRLKENIKSTKISGLELINKIQLKEFDWKENKSHQKIGFIANELEELDPMLVFGKNDEMRSVNDFYLQAYEIKAIQELYAENQKLKKEIEQIKSQLSEQK